MSPAMQRTRRLLGGARRRARAGFARMQPSPAARSVMVRPSDVFVVSYPRSGSTWMRFMLANALRPEQETTFANVDELLPSIYLHPDRRLRPRSSPRILHSHEPFDPRYPPALDFARPPAVARPAYLP